MQDTLFDTLQLFKETTGLEFSQFCYTTFARQIWYTEQIQDE